MTDEEIRRIAANLRAAEAKTHEQNGKHEAPKEDRPLVEPGDVAGIPDLVRAGALVRWLWSLWVAQGTLTALAAPAGHGKTRLVSDLLRRIRHGLPWPDGTAMTMPPDTVSLWVMADNHHDQLVGIAQRFGLEDVVKVNASKAEPYGGVTLETVEDYATLEARIADCKAGLVVVDTVGNATERSLGRQEDAKAFYQPLQVIARRHACAIICITHLNASGHFLGRRVLEKVRVALKLEKFPGQDRLRLEVAKTFDRTPPPLGVTMGEDGNEYDTDPPEAPDEGTGQVGRPSSAINQAVDWLRDALTAGPKAVSLAIEQAEREGISMGTLYRAMRTLKVEETLIQGRKYWHLTNDDLAG